MTLPFHVRPLEEADVYYILHSWLKGGKDDVLVGRYMPANLFFPQYERVIKEILNHPLSRCLVAHNPEDSSHIIGYGVFTLMPHDKKIAACHYLTTKKAFRGIGVSKTIVGKLQGEEGVEGLVSSYPPCKRLPGPLKTALYNPFLFYQFEKLFLGDE